MASCRAVLLCTMLTAACEGAATGPSVLGTDAAFVATQTDLAGQWQVIGVYAGGYDEEFIATTTPSPLALTFGAGDLAFEAPCRVCRAAARRVLQRDAGGRAVRLALRAPTGLLDLKR